MHLDGQLFLNWPIHSSIELIVFLLDNRLIYFRFRPKDDTTEEPPTPDTASTLPVLSCQYPRAVSVLLRFKALIYPEISTVLTGMVNFETTP